MEEKESVKMKNALYYLDTPYGKSKINIRKLVSRVYYHANENETVYNCMMICRYLSMVRDPRFIIYGELLEKFKTLHAEFETEYGDEKIHELQNRFTNYIGKLFWYLYCDFEHEDYVSILAAFSA